MTVYKRDRFGRIIPKNKINSTKGTWYVDKMIRGRRYRFAVPEATTRRQAERAEAKLKTEIFEARYGSKGKSSFVKFVDGKQAVVETRRAVREDHQGFLSRVQLRRHLAVADREIQANAARRADQSRRATRGQHGKQRDGAAIEDVQPGFETGLLLGESMPAR
jgi:hypothetical protein